jgi:hypothetical protein
LQYRAEGAINDMQRTRETREHRQAVDGWNMHPASYSLLAGAVLPPGYQKSVAALVETWGYTHIKRHCMQRWDTGTCGKEDTWSYKQAYAIAHRLLQQAHPDELEFETPIWIESDMSGILVAYKSLSIYMLHRAYTLKFTHISVSLS